MSVKRQYHICFILILVIGLIIAGNYIINMEMIKSMDSMKKSIKTQKSKLTILVEVDKKTLSLIDRENEKTLNSYTIATGKSNSPTPLGRFKIVQKSRWGEGFGSRWIGLNVPWGNYGIHGTNQPGSIGQNVSAGCIRMRNHDIEELYDLVSVDVPVIIMNGEYGPLGQGYRILKPGDRGADVLEVQKRLSQKGYYQGPLDGIYGEGMKFSLIKFLRDNNMELTDKIDYDIYAKLGIIIMD